MRPARKISTIVAIGVAAALALSGCTQKNQTESGSAAGGSGSGGGTTQWPCLKLI